MKQNLKRYFFYYLLPLFLFAIGVFSLLNYLKATEFGVLNLDYRGISDQLISTRSGDLLRGDVVRGTFSTPYDNLGLISIRFYNQDRDSDDILVFRIKEDGRKKWYYEAQYKTDQFLPHQLFSFGFPIINDSSGKTYDFELESLMGATGSGILIDRKIPVFIAKSSFNKDVLLGDKTKLSTFIFNKSINMLGDENTIVNLISFFLPLIVFFIFVFSKGIGFQFLTSITILFIIYDTLFLQDSYDAYLLTVMFLWGLTCSRFRFESKISAIFALIYLVFTPILLLLKQEAMAEKTTTWAYLFLSATVVQQIYEIKKHPKNRFTPEKFKNNLFKFNLNQRNFFLRLVKHTFKPIVLIITTYLLYRFGQRVFQSLLLYQLFFPNGYLTKFLVDILLPNIILLISSFFIFFKLNKHFKKPLFLSLLTTLVIFISSTSIIDQATKFRDYPIIIFIAPNNVIEAWADITIEGKNFGDQPFQGKVLLNEEEQRIMNWTDTRIIFRTNPQTMKSGMLRVETTKNGVTDKLQFNYLFKYSK